MGGRSGDEFHGVLHIKVIFKNTAGRIKPSDWSKPLLEEAAASHDLPNGVSIHPDHFLGIHPYKIALDGYPPLKALDSLHFYPCPSLIAITSPINS